MEERTNVEMLVKGCNGQVEYGEDTQHEDYGPQYCKIYLKYIKTVSLTHIQRNKKKSNHMC